MYNLSFAYFDGRHRWALTSICVYVHTHATSDGPFHLGSDLLSYLRSDDLHSAYRALALQIGSPLLPRFAEHLAARQEPSMCTSQEQEEGSTISGLFRVADDCCTRACLRHLATWVVYGGWLVGLLRPVGKFGAYVSATEECAIKIRWILANGCEVFVPPAAPAAPAKWNPEPSGRQFSPLQMSDGSHINCEPSSLGQTATLTRHLIEGADICEYCIP